VSFFDSFRVSSCSSSSSTGARRAAASSGASLIPVCLGVNRYGSAVTSYASTVVARAVPSREEIVPRSAASGTVM
jgi:hypothetical protein